VKLEEPDEIPSNQIDGKLEGTIELPGSLSEKGFGYKSVGSDLGRLTQEYKFIGKAWFTR
jgi:hypothetical protein